VVFRGAKLELEPIDPTLIAAADRPGRTLVARIHLTDGCGGARCATVEPPALEWSVREDRPLERHRRTATRRPSCAVRWFTSDLHLGHENVIAYAGRPFRSVGEMDARLVASWNAVVSPDDEVWVLGDLAMGRIDESLSIAGQLVGRKHLLVGNHDRPFDEGRRRDEWTRRYLDDAGFVELHHGDVDLALAEGAAVRLCHFPYRGDSGDRDRYVEARPVDDGRWLLHGHVHEKWRQRGRMINVGIDAWAGCPVSEEQLAGLVAGGDADLDRLAWD
jgi:calcineurin-like phosphoesterase family protein